MPYFYSFNLITRVKQDQRKDYQHFDHAPILSANYRTQMEAIEKVFFALGKPSIKEKYRLCQISS